MRRDYQNLYSDSDKADLNEEERFSIKMIRYLEQYKGTTKAFTEDLGLRVAIRGINDGKFIFQ